MVVDWARQLIMFPKHSYDYILTQIPGGWIAMIPNFTETQVDSGGSIEAKSKEAKAFLKHSCFLF